jgi:hypothetical protein
MIVDEVDVERVAVHETEDDAPVGANRDSPKPFRSPFRECSLKVGWFMSSIAAASSNAESMR